MVSVVSLKRMHGLVQTTNNGSLAALSPRNTDKHFHSRNLTLAAGTLDDNMGRDLTDSAL